MEAFSFSSLIIVQEKSLFLLLPFPFTAFGLKIFRQGDIIMDYLASVNSAPLYLVVGAVLLFVLGGCLWFIVRSYRAGLKIGMDKEVLKKTITSSALFTVLPAVSILLGVIALSGSLGVPTAWLRLSVVGNLSYEAIAAESASQAMGVELNTATMTPSNLVTIIAVMTSGICWGILCTIFFLKRYSRKCQTMLNKGKGNGKKSFADWAMVAMFIGFCGTFIGAYASEAVRGTWVPLITALVAALVMKICQFFSEKKNAEWLENFSLALSMLVAMASSVLVSL